MIFNKLTHHALQVLKKQMKKTFYCPVTELGDITELYATLIGLRPLEP